MTKNKIPEVLILGLPNAGKSTLVNALSKRKTSIIGSTPNTTRDKVTTTLEFEDEKKLLISDLPGFLEDPDDINLMVVYIFLMLSTLNIWADIDFGYLFSNTFGLLLLVGSFAAIGIYFSSLTSQPIIAAILSFIFAFLLLGLESYFASQPNHWFHHVSLLKHFQTFSRGVISSKDIIYFLLFISTFIVLTIRRLDADRLRG